jgi:hypothetical protein
MLDSTYTCPDFVSCARAIAFAFRSRASDLGDGAIRSEQVASAGKRSGEDGPSWKISPRDGTSPRAHDLRSRVRALPGDRLVSSGGNTTPKCASPALHSPLSLGVASESPPPAARTAGAWVGRLRASAGSHWTLLKCSWARSFSVALVTLSTLFARAVFTLDERDGMSWGADGWGQGRHDSGFRYRTTPGMAGNGIGNRSQGVLMV